MVERSQRPTAWQREHEQYTVEGQREPEPQASVCHDGSPAGKTGIAMVDGGELEKELARQQTPKKTQFELTGRQTQPSAQLEARICHELHRAETAPAGPSTAGPVAHVKSSQSPPGNGSPVVRAGIDSAMHIPVPVPDGCRGLGEHSSLIETGHSAVAWTDGVAQAKPSPAKITSTGKRI